MKDTRTQRVIEAMDMNDIDAADDYSCDDIRTAWLCAQLSSASNPHSFDAVWIDRN
jgi:hypothetical protein